MAREPRSAASIVQAYARALLEIAAAEDAVSEVCGDLERLRGLLETHPDLASFLRERALRPEGKRRALTELLEGRVHALVLDWLCALVGQGRGALAADAVDACLETAARPGGRQVVGEAVTAFPLSDGQREALEAALSDSLDRPVRLSVRVDPSVLGGVRLRVGSRVIDGTARRRLERLREQLIG